MKTIKLLMLSVCMLTLFSCKKGKDDPLLSLNTRNQNIVGTWKLISGTVNYTVEFSKQTITYTEEEMSSTGEGIFNPSSAEAHSFMITLNKDGSTQAVLLNASANDSWHWNNGVKKKTGLYLPMKNLITRPCDFNFTIDKLTVKELNLAYRSVSTTTTNNVRTMATEIELFFEKQ